MTPYPCLASLDGTPLHLAVDQPARPRAQVVLLHGLAEHGGRYDHVAQALVAAGFGVYRHDHRGHGRSGGDRGALDRFEALVEDTGQVVQQARAASAGRPVFMLGHSMGGLVAAAYAARCPERYPAVDGVVFSAAAVLPPPAVKPLKFAPWRLMPRQRVPNSAADGISRDPAVVAAYRDDPLVLKELTLGLLGQVFIKGIEQVHDEIGGLQAPCLVLHGGGDTLVPPPAAQWLVDHVASSDKALTLYDGLAHEILNEPERAQVIDHLCRWLLQRSP